MPLFTKTKQKAQIMNDIIMSVPDKVLVGPMLEWKIEYRKLIKDIRRGKIDYLQNLNKY